MVDGPIPAESAAPAAPRVVVERPPPGLARGKVAWPAWGIGLFGGAVVVAGLVWLVWRMSHRSRRR